MSIPFDPQIKFCESVFQRARDVGKHVHDDYKWLIYKTFAISTEIQRHIQYTSIIILYYNFKFLRIM